MIHLEGPFYLLFCDPESWHGYNSQRVSWHQESVIHGSSRLACTILSHILFSLSLSFESYFMRKKHHWAQAKGTFKTFSLVMTSICFKKAKSENMIKTNVKIIYCKQAIWIKNKLYLNQQHKCVTFWYFYLGCTRKAMRTRHVFAYNNGFIFIYNYKELLSVLKWLTEGIHWLNKRKMGVLSCNIVKHFPK